MFIVTVGGILVDPEIKKQELRSHVHKNTSYGLVPLVTPVISITIYIQTNLSPLSVVIMSPVSVKIKNVSDGQ